MFLLWILFITNGSGIGFSNTPSFRFWFRWPRIINRCIDKNCKINISGKIFDSLVKIIIHRN